MKQKNPESVAVETAYTLKGYITLYTLQKKGESPSNGNGNGNGNGNDTETKELL